MVDFTQETHQPGLTMKIMYTTTPDEGCREVADGIYGRPAHTTEQPKLRKQGWAYSINDIEVPHVRQEKEGRQEEAEVDDERDVWVALYEEKFGKKPHHKTKLDTIIAKVEGDAD